MKMLYATWIWSSIKEMILTACTSKVQGTGPFPSGKMRSEEGKTEGPLEHNRISVQLKKTEQGWIWEVIKEKSIKINATNRGPVTSDQGKERMIITAGNFIITQHHSINWFYKNKKNPSSL